MTTSARVFLATALVVAVAAAPVGAASRKTYSYSATLSSATVSSAHGFPQVGGTAVYAGSLKSRPFGDGALIDHVTITGQQANVFTFTGKEIDYFADGSQRNTFTGTVTVQSDGSQKVVVRGHFTGGSSRYKGATGSYTFHGTTPSGSTVLSGSSSGSLRF